MSSAELWTRDERARSFANENQGLGEGDTSDLYMRALAPVVRL